MKKDIFKIVAVTCVVALAALFMIQHPASAQTGPSLTVVPFNGQNNVCANPSIPKAHLLINLTAGTSQLVAPVAGAKVHVCGFFASFAGTTPALTLITGTQTTTACDTGAVNLTGAILPTTGTFVSANPQTSSLVVGATSGQVCALVAGSIQGVMTYVQQ